jgi:hypothetical protein
MMTSFGFYIAAFLFFSCDLAKNKVLQKTFRETGNGSQQRLSNITSIAASPAGFQQRPMA